MLDTYLDCFWSSHVWLLIFISKGRFWLGYFSSTQSSQCSWEFFEKFHMNIFPWNPTAKRYCLVGSYLLHASYNGTFNSEASNMHYHKKLQRNNIKFMYRKLENFWIDPGNKYQWLNKHLISKASMSSYDHNYSCHWFSATSRSGLELGILYTFNICNSHFRRNYYLQYND